MSAAASPEALLEQLQIPGPGKPGELSRASEIGEDGEIGEGR